MNRRPGIGNNLIVMRELDIRWQNKAIRFICREGMVGV